MSVLDDLLAQSRLLCRLRHPNIACLYAVVIPDHLLVQCTAAGGAEDTAGAGTAGLPALAAPSVSPSVAEAVTAAGARMTPQEAAEAAARAVQRGQMAAAAAAGEAARTLALAAAGEAAIRAAAEGAIDGPGPGPPPSPTSTVPSTVLLSEYEPSSGGHDGLSYYGGGSRTASMGMSLISRASTHDAAGASVVLPAASSGTRSSRGGSAAAPSAQSSAALSPLAAAGSDEALPGRERSGSVGSSATEGARSSSSTAGTAPSGGPTAVGPEAEGAGLTGPSTPGFGVTFGSVSTLGSAATSSVFAPLSALPPDPNADAVQDAQGTDQGGFGDDDGDGGHGGSPGSGAIGYVAGPGVGQRRPILLHRSGRLPSIREVPSGANADLVCHLISLCIVRG